MALRKLAFALGLVVAASPVPATVQDPATPTAPPAGTFATRYCMHIEAITGSRLEEVTCWTRQEWAEHGVDVDKDWPREGVRTIG